MITRTASSWHTEDWQIALSNSIRTLDALCEALGLPAEMVSEGMGGERDFPVRVPLGYLAKIKKGDLDDPLLKQVLPLGAEKVAQPGFVADPLAEQSSNPQTGLLHKYQSRVLLVLGGACAINCRYCFRRHFPYEDNQLSGQELFRIQTYLMEHPEVNEVVLSGGDPLLQNNARLAKLLKIIEAVPSITRVRIHTRLPVVIPQRIDQGLIALLGDSKLKVLLVTHVNHAQELDEDFDLAMGYLKAAGVTLLNQSVLLHAVNNDAQTLAQLSERLFQADVLPYYLHLLDPVAGAHHFDVPQGQARELMYKLQGLLPGFLIPRLVREIPGKSGKTLIDLHLS